MEFASYLLLGCLAGFLSGLLGIGGGLVMVPGLAFIFDHFAVVPHSQLMHLSIGTSLASSIINLIIATRAHHMRNAVKWSVFQAMWPGVLGGTLVIGPLIMIMVNEKILQILFGVFCLLIFLQFVLQKHGAMVEERLPGKKQLALIGLGIGSLSTLLGIAGGAMVGSVLHHYHVDARKVVGTSASVSIIIAVTATIGLFFASRGQTLLPTYSTGYLYWPAFIAAAIPSVLVTPLGAKLAHVMPVHLLKKLFGGLMLVIGIKMLLTGV